MTNRMILLIVAATVLLSCCTIPRAGALKQEFINNSEAQELNITSLASLTDVPARTLDTSIFSSVFTDAEIVDFDKIAPGDEMTVSIFESVTNRETLMFENGVAVFESLTVDEEGKVTIPFVGATDTVGRSKDEIARAIEVRLSDQVFRPQVDVRIESQSRGGVSIIGGEEGGMLLSSEASRLSAVLGHARIDLSDPVGTGVTLRRGALQETISIEAFLNMSQNDVALRSGDTVIISEIPRHVVALGAVNLQQRLELPSGDYSLLETVADINGLNDDLADPSAVFLIRRQSLEVGSAPNIYSMDATDPFQMAIAGRFQVEDGDIIYVSNARFAQAEKVISTIVAGSSVFSPAITAGLR